MRLTSPAFEDGERIPDEYGYEQRNVNPPLRVEDVPDHAESLVLLVDDPDAVEPAGKVWDHWVVWNIDPDVGKIPEGWTVESAVEGRNDYGEQGYGGPNPPDRPHAYRFRVYALDSTIAPENDTSVEEIEAATKGKEIAEAELTGTYAP